MKRIIARPKAAWWALAGLMVVGLSACDALDDLLAVDNPEEIPEDQLRDETLIRVLVNGTIGAFQAALDDPFIWRGSMFTDEQITGINWEQTARLSQRVVSFDEGDPDMMFTELSLARSMADSVSGRIKNLVENTTSDGRLATTLAYAGYSYILLGDAMCQSTVNVGSELHESPAMYQFAVERFEEALPIAGAAGKGDLENLIRVGLSRAHLNLGNTADVLSIAPAVPADFMWWADYDPSDTRVDNVLESRVTGSNHSLGVHPRFLAGGRSEMFGEQGLAAFLTDPRIQHTPDWSLGHNRLTWLYTPMQGLLHSEYSGETFAAGGNPVTFGRGTDIAFASGLEALHNFHEASGPTAETLAFVNARRAVGNQDAVDLAGDELMAELRDQRGRDLILAGYRLGDLRRWKRLGVGDLFPSGLHPTTQWGQYGSATCFPLPQEEFEGNPNISLPGSN